MELNQLIKLIFKINTREAVNYPLTPRKYFVLYSVSLFNGPCLIVGDFMKTFFALTLSLTMLSGCASIFNDSTQTIYIASNNNTPFRGTMNGAPFSGPGTISVPRSKFDKILSIETPACQKQVLLSSTVDIKFFMNIFLIGIGSTTDYGTDRMWKFQDSVLISCK